MIGNQTRRFEQRLDRVDQSLETLTQRLDGVDQRLDRVDQRLDGIDQRLDGIGQRLDRVDGSIEGLTQRVAKIEESLARVSQYTLEFRQETVGRLLMIETKQDIPMSIMTSMESKLQPLTKAITEFGAISPPIQAHQWKQTDNTFDLATRVSKLEEIASKLKPAA